MTGMREEGEFLGLNNKVENLWGLDKYSENWRVNKVTQSHEKLHMELSKQHKQPAQWTKEGKSLLNPGTE